MITKYRKFVFLLGMFISCVELSAFQIKPGIVNLEAGKEITVNLIPDSPEEYGVTYRLLIEGDPSALSLLDTSNKKIDSVTLKSEGMTQFKIKAAPDSASQYIILAFDSRPLGQETTSQLIFARQGLGVTITAAPAAASETDTHGG